MIHINSATATTGRPSAWEGLDLLKVPVSDLEGISVELASQRRKFPVGWQGKKVFPMEFFPVPDCPATPSHQSCTLREF